MRGGKLVPLRLVRLVHRVLTCVVHRVAFGIDAAGGAAFDCPEIEIEGVCGKIILIAIRSEIDACMFLPMHNAAKFKNVFSSDWTDRSSHSELCGATIMTA